MFFHIIIFHNVQIILFNFLLRLHSTDELPHVIQMCSFVRNKCLVVQKGSYWELLIGVLEQIREVEVVIDELEEVGASSASLDDVVSKKVKN